MRDVPKPTAQQLDGLIVTIFPPQKFFELICTVHDDDDDDSELVTESMDGDDAPEPDVRGRGPGGSRRTMSGASALMALKAPTRSSFNSSGNETAPALCALADPRIQGALAEC